VGIVVGQIAKLQGCRVVGIAGTEKQNYWLTILALIRWSIIKQLKTLINL
jgi:NADPH-dependent curcumin reductase CurA